MQDMLYGQEWAGSFGSSVLRDAKQPHLPLTEEVLERTEHLLGEPGESNQSKNTAELA